MGFLLSVVEQLHRDVVRGALVNEDRRFDECDNEARSHDRRERLGRRRQPARPASSSSSPVVVAWMVVIEAFVATDATKFSHLLDHASDLYFVFLCAPMRLRPLPS